MISRTLAIFAFFFAFMVVVVWLADALDRRP